MIKTIRNVDLFSNVDIKVLESLITNNQISLNSYQKGVTVHEQDKECLGIEFVLSGHLVAYSLASSGSETIVFDFKENTIIGANLLFAEGNKYPMNIYSTNKSLTLYISKSGVYKLLKDYNFTIEFIKSISKNSEGMNHKIAMYTQKTLRENLIDYLLSLSDSQNSKEVILPLSKKELADYFGVQRPSLFRELKKMKDEGLLVIDNKNIKLNFLEK